MRQSRPLCRRVRGGSGLAFGRARRVVRACLVRVIRPRGGSGDGPVEEGVLGGSHPLEQAVAVFAEDLLAGGVSGEVAQVVGVEEEVVELLLGDALLAPAGLNEDLLAAAVVAVGEDGAVVLGDAADVLEALAADGAQGAGRWRGRSSRRRGRR